MTDDDINMWFCITSFSLSVMNHAERGKVLQPNSHTVCISSSLPGISATAVMNRSSFNSENSSADTLLSRASVLISSDVWRSGSIDPYILQLDTLWVVSEEFQVLAILLPKKEHLIHFG
jgi:hypothetical protein